MNEQPTRKLDTKLRFGDKNFDLDEIPDQIDISINLPPKKVPDATKMPKKQDSVALF